jgi:hypothetical protein
VNKEVPVMRRAPIALGFGLVAAVIAFGALAWTADAHRIKLGKAYNLSVRDAEAVCADDPTCLGTEVEPCRRINAHVARCKVHVFGEDKLGPYDCEWTDQWKIKKKRRRLIWNPRVFEQTLACYADSGGHFVPEPLAARAADRG